MVYSSSFRNDVQDGPMSRFAKLGSDEVTQIFRTIQYGHDMYLSMNMKLKITLLDKIKKDHKKKEVRPKTAVL